MKVQIKVWVVRYQPSYMDKPTWTLYTHKCRDDEDTIVLREQLIEVEVPDDDMTAERVAAVRGEIQRVYAEAEGSVKRLKEIEGNLLALTNEVPAQTVEVGDDIPL